jgi:hypothetical protein
MRFKTDTSWVQVRCFGDLEQNSNALKIVCLHHQKLTRSPKHLSLFHVHTAVIAFGFHEKLRLYANFLSLLLRNKYGTIPGCSMLLVPVYYNGADLTVLKTH